MFESLGVTELEERIYLAMLRDPGATLANLVVDLKVSEEELQTGILVIERKGLIRRSSEMKCGYVPEMPDTVVERFIQRRREEFDFVRAYLPQLRKEYKHSLEQEHPREIVEVISGREAVAECFVRVQMSATECLRGFNAPPYACTSEDEQHRNPLEFQRLREGIQYRIVYESSGGQFMRPEELRISIEAGEQARVSPHVPMKLLIADRQLAMMPIVPRSSASDSPAQTDAAYLIRQSTVLDALVALFEKTWETARPLSLLAKTTPRDDAEEEEQERLLEMMAAGLTDDVIAVQMGTSIRTIRRRARDLMDRLGAVSRFQAGMQAAKRGWL